VKSELYHFAEPYFFYFLDAIGFVDASFQENRLFETEETFG